MTANDTQVGGDHYKKEGLELQHWDIVALMGWDYFQGNITKYVDRHARKNGYNDLKKAAHYLQKYMELNYPDEMDADSEPVFARKEARPEMAIPAPTEVLEIPTYETRPVSALTCRRCNQLGHINIDCTVKCLTCMDARTVPDADAGPWGKPCPDCASEPAQEAAEAAVVGAPAEVPSEVPPEGSGEPGAGS